MTIYLDLIWKTIISGAALLFVILQIREKITKHRKEMDDAMLALNRALINKEAVIAYNRAADIENEKIELAQRRMPMLANRKTLIEDAIAALSKNQDKTVSSFDTSYKDAILYSWRNFKSIQHNLEFEPSKDKWPVSAINDEAERAKIKIDNYRYLPETQKDKLRPNLNSDLLTKANRIKEMVDQDILITRTASEKPHIEKLPYIDTTKEELDFKRAKEWWKPRVYSITKSDR